MAKKLFNNLSTRYQAFVSEYLIHQNLAKSAQKAGSRAKNLSQAGKELLNKPEITAALAELQGDLQEKLRISPEKVIKELARIGFSDIRKIVDNKNGLKNIQELDDDSAACVSAVEIVTTPGKKPVITKKIRLWDKKGALELLAKNLGMFQKDNLQKRPLVIVKDFAGED